MNLSERLRYIPRFFYAIYLFSRQFLPRQKSNAFTRFSKTNEDGIGQVYVINLDRKPDRWVDVCRELRKIVNSSGFDIATQTTRCSATDAQDSLVDIVDDGNLYSFYTLNDQLFVEPQPSVLPEKFELDRPIKMSRAEIAVAQSHIGVWKTIADGVNSYALVLEDDVLFERDFSTQLDRAWTEMKADGSGEPKFDVLYLSYKEAKHGAPKQFISKTVFRPERGLWYLSGYVLSKRGAKRLIQLLPCRGPIDLWINHLFSRLVVRATSRSAISQRLDLTSTNTYSILASLTKIGVLDGEYSGLFHIKPKELPVFAFDTAASGASSLAMALSMLGYRCCSDLDNLPQIEFEKLTLGTPGRVFNAYVNIGCLTPNIEVLKILYPRAKFIVLLAGSIEQDGDHQWLMDRLRDADTLNLKANEPHKWRVLCEHLKCAPPPASYPEVTEIGQRVLHNESAEITSSSREKNLKRDSSPWAIEANIQWDGVQSKPVRPWRISERRVSFLDSLAQVDSQRWSLRDDTFPGNLALFRPANVNLQKGEGVTLVVKPEQLGVREFSAAAISSGRQYLYGRFEVALRATNIPGLVTGFFLHRDSPRQEIDIEIVGARPDELLTNVFYNPGGEGAKFDYGFRGSPCSVCLNFDASESVHRYAIEWDPCEIRWFVDDQLVHKRFNWNPTPIPHLPMTLHVNNWPTRSHELAGRLVKRALPASALIRSISIDAQEN